MKVKKEYILKTVGEQIIVVPVGKEAVKFHGMINLNQTGKFIFEALREEISMDELIHKVVDQYEVSDEIASADVIKFIDTLKEKNILE